MASTMSSLEVNNKQNNNQTEVCNVSNFAKISLDKNLSPAYIIDEDSTGNGDESQKELTDGVSKNEVACHSAPTRPSVRRTPRRYLQVEATPSRGGKRMRDSPRGGRGKGKNEQVDSTKR